MKKVAPILVGVVICIMVVGISYGWVSNLMDSLYAYRSPLHNSPPSTGAALGDPQTRSLVLVLVDGLRYDTSMNAAVMPYLNQLRRQGAFAEMHSQPPSYSEPGYSTLLTGAWPFLNDGPVLNLDYADIPTLTQDNIFSNAHWIGLQTAISGFNWFQKLVPQGAVTGKFYTAGEDQAADRDVVDAALPWLQSAPYQLVLIHLDQVDYAGHHQGGPNDPRYDAAATRADALIKQIVAHMDLNQDTLLVVSDHGHINQGGHGGQDAITLLEPFVLVGKGVMPGKYGDVQMVDVAPTIAVILGTSLPAANQGHPQVGMLDLSLDQVERINTALSLQQGQLVQAYQTAIGHPVNVHPATDVVSASQAAILATQNSIIDNQMLPRGIIAIIVLFLLVNLAAWHSRPNFGTMLIGVVGYLVIFNLKYLLIDQKTYSLSSVVDATNLFTSTALTTLLALLVGWILVMIGTKVYQYKPRKAADLTMKSILVLLSVLYIPIFTNYAINGAIVTWALPNFLFGFLGLIFLIQVLMVAGLGIVFTGLAALLGVFSRTR
jgi:hypothetical protein